MGMVSIKRVHICEALRKRKAALTIWEPAWRVQPHFGVLLNTDKLAHQYQARPLCD